MKLLLAVMAASQAFSSRLQAALAPFDLALAEFEVLVRVGKSGTEETRAGGVRMSDLAAAGLLTSSGLTRLVDRLERRGLLERRPAADDARGRTVILSAEGRALLPRADAAFARELDAMLRDAGVTKKDIGPTLELLGRIQETCAAGPSRSPA